MRTAILADKLIKRGHNILWWASSFDHIKKEMIFKKDTELTVKRSLKILALKGTGYKKNISLSRYVDHRIIARKFKKLALKMPKPDIIITSTPPHDLAYEAVTFSKGNNIPVLVDIRDEWPDLFLNVVPGKFQKLVKILLFNDYRKLKKTMLMADGLIAMMDSLLDWGLRYTERSRTSKDRVFYLGSKGNAVNNKSMTKHSFLQGIENKFIVVFVGTFVKNNDPSILIDCAKKLLDKNIHFVMAGDGELFNQIRKKASGLSNISMPGWLNQAEISNLLQNSHVGVCLTPKIRDAFPNKAFTYLSAGLPLISAFQGDSKEIIKKCHIGLYYPPNDLNALVSCITRLYEDSALHKEMSKNACRIFNEMFDADKIYEEYAEHIERAVDNYR
ncbi:hypothetical protein LCGC14_0818790 [marine sediment metagenome]|uniref:Glycosyl transferase family 1 domain-containing protein n=1 Tax=marine sediment metagenome TaxID=412755 RepID=A0A0F9PP36_9ZZZZ|nr:glycosyltransferase WbuB [Candidatus Aminicenantes bacterium]